MEHTSVLFALFVAFTAAKLAAELFERLGQPAVVGELAVGILVGPSVLGWISLAGSEGEVMLLLAELGVIVLLFQVGLETEPSELRAVGGQAVAVGILGVLLPFAGGFGVALIAGKTGIQSAFVATAMVATSVGITARVLADLGKLTTRAARIILGAAVIDDILGLMVLTVVAGLSGGDLSGGDIIVLVIEAMLFVGALMLFGPRVINRISHLLEAPRIRRAPFALALVLLLGLSVAAEEIGLAAIIGAFLAGTLLSSTRESYALEHQVQPVADLLTPFFFVVTGAQIELDAFTDADVLSLASVITVVAIVGKLVAGIVGTKGIDRRESLIVGVGMVPRGEVGIIVASLALQAGVVERDLFGVVLLMVVVTTLAAPPVLQRLFAGAEPAMPS